MKIDLIEVNPTSPKDPGRSVGYFQCSDSQVYQLVPGKAQHLEGVFVQTEAGRRIPRGDKHYQARFAYRSEEVIFPTTLALTSEASHQRHPAVLHLHPDR